MPSITFRHLALTARAEHHGLDPFRPITTAWSSLHLFVNLDLNIHILVFFITSMGS